MLRWFLQPQSSVTGYPLHLVPWTAMFNILLNNKSEEEISKESV